MKNFEQIVCNSQILGGKPCIKGTRISIEMILEWIGQGASIYDILKNYPQMNELSVKQAIAYSSECIENDT